MESKLTVIFDNFEMNTLYPDVLNISFKCTYPSFPVVFHANLQNVIYEMLTNNLL